MIDYRKNLHTYLLLLELWTDASVPALCPGVGTALVRDALAALLVLQPRSIEPGARARLQMQLADFESRQTAGHADRGMSIDSARQLVHQLLVGETLAVLDATIETTAVAHAARRAKGKPVDGRIAAAYAALNAALARYDVELTRALADEPLARAVTARAGARADRALSLAGLGG